MEKETKLKIKTQNDEILGSETVFEKLRGKTPWIFGKKIRKPKVVYPKVKLPRMDMPLPARSLIIIIVYIALFLLQTGIVYILYRTPMAIGANQEGQPIILYPDIQDAFIIESIVASIFIFLCSLGFVMLYQASKYVYNKKIAIRILVIGIILIISTFFALQAMISIKLGNPLFNV
ncbi:MAG: hypothetical protein EU531_05095 [Promethearchaeota archaeon]|nr:MAG: hypothetical protein EU531_05095 [Candidatus Lokiarchaeota archaeon]